MDLSGKRIVVTGGTGSLGGVLVRRIMAGDYGTPERVTVFSRDEAKQHAMRMRYAALFGSNGHGSAHQPILRFRLGDVRDFASVAAVVRDADIIFNAAALKQVPNCEYAPAQAVMTNVLGAINLVRAVAEHGAHVETVVGITTDKACEPINVMGMTKALQERILVEGNLQCRNTRFICVRYGNVIASTGSVVPIFLKQIEERQPITITHTEMTRFLLTLDQAVDTIAAAVRSALPGETYVPKIPAARVVDIARVLMGDLDLPIVYLGIRPGEKVHEVLVSQTECFRTIERDGYYVIAPILPELWPSTSLEVPALTQPFTSREVTCDAVGLRSLLSTVMPTLADIPATSVLAGR
jgi:UDP-glucose 4-epimerase